MKQKNTELSKPANLMSGAIRATTGTAVCGIDHDDDDNRPIQTAVGIIDIPFIGGLISIPVCGSCAIELHADEWRFFLKICLRCGRTKWVHRGDSKKFGYKQISQHWGCKNCIGGKNE